MTRLWKKLLVAASIIVVCNTSPDTSCENLAKMLVGPAVGVALAVATVYTCQWIECRWSECCSETWTKPKIEAMRKDLNSKVFGQDNAIDLILKALSAHYSNPNPDRALVLSFQGDTGIGKNFVSNIIANNTYRYLREGNSKSAYVLTLVGHTDFSNHVPLEHQREMLKNEIVARARSCERCLFILDELHSIRPGVLEVLTDFVDHGFWHGVSFRKSVFILLSNTAADEIRDYALAHLSMDGSRIDISKTELEEIVKTATLNRMDGALSQSDLIKNHRISHFVPFLPLTADHVVLCIRAEVLKRGRVITDMEKLVGRVMGQLAKTPLTQDRFVAAGCKNLDKRVGLELESTNY